MEALLVPLPPPMQEVLPCLACRKPLNPEDFHSHLQECQSAWPPAVSPPLVPCQYCTRHFLPSRLAIHENACSTAHCKRPVVEKSSAIMKTRKPSPSFAQTKWFKQHLSVLSSLRWGYNALLYENYVQCPTCSRRFAPHAAERHILLCRNTNRLHALKPQAGTAPLRHAGNLITDSRSVACLRHKSELNHCE